MENSWLRNIIEKLELIFDFKKINSPSKKIINRVGEIKINIEQLNIQDPLTEKNLKDIIDLIVEKKFLDLIKITNRQLIIDFETTKVFHKNLNMQINKNILTKTDYILWRECKKNVWLKIHKPEIYNTAELSEFEKQIIETGNEVEKVARQLFPTGILIEGRGEEAQEKTKRLLDVGRPAGRPTSVLFQPEFLKDHFLAACDILELNPDGTYNIYEVKSTTDVDKKTHYHDLAFQVNLLEKCGLKIKKASVIHLNSEYVRHGEIEIHKLFKIEDVTETVESIKEGVLAEMVLGLKYLSQESEPKGYCDCVYKGRSNHCSTFAYSNPKVPAYGVHDISRIGASKAKLQELIDVGIFELQDVPEDMELSVTQKNQIKAHVQDKIFKDAVTIQKELDMLDFPLYFLDYETFPCAIPRFDGFSPYQQIPFQYSLYVLSASSGPVLSLPNGVKGDSPKSQPQQYEFIFTENTDPSLEFLTSLRSHIGDVGTIIVWNKKFECKINEQLAERNPDYTLFIEVVNARVYDLMDIFSMQWYVHKDFKGKVSIKNILPVLVPELSYKDLEIQEGGTASQRWNEISQGNVGEAEKQKIIKDLKIYCGLDTYAMYAIWKHLTYLGS